MSGDLSSSGGYQPSPRPTFDRPTAIPRSQAVHHVWGDEQAGEVLDWIFVSSDKIHQLLFQLPAHGQFTHSDEHRTRFAADEVLHVVEGAVAFADPESGEVVRVDRGESLFFRRDTWHHAFNWTSSPALVLEYFAPPPATGTSGSYARDQALLEASSYQDDSILGELVPGKVSARRAGRLAVVRQSDYSWRLEGAGNPVLAGIIASTEHLTVASCEVRGQGWSGWLSHGGDAGGYVLSGDLALRVSGGSDRTWYEVVAGDGFFIPEGATYQVRNLARENAVYLLGAAPSYTSP